mmetsp:Transcript_17482/g.37915  ORF Transcript_17482/g.37915 Transcript_17482/m.37915 type:complete len:322 (-) Transcript_17482:96-1061(-)
MSKKRKTPSSPSLAGAGGGSVFAALSKLESDDVKAAKTRRMATAASSARSLAAQNQTGIAGDLAQCRILLQRAIGEASQNVPTGTASSGVDETVISSADRLLVKLLGARKQLCNGNIMDTDTDNDVDYSELLDDDSSGNSTDDAVFEKALSSGYGKCRSEWKGVFNRRHHDLRLHAGLTAKTASKFRVMDQSFWDQVESTAAHDRLIASDSSSTPVFDDSKVYQHMLRDFVALGTSATGGGRSGAGFAADAAAERLRRAAQKKKGRSGKDVDRKASKGRKIRYTVNPKLENFTFPISRPVASIGEDDWFRSLFGGVGRRSR